MIKRTRRLRKTENIRRLVRENRLTVDDLIYPLFIEEGENIETEIVSMPGIKQCGGAPKDWELYNEHHGIGVKPMVALVCYTHASSPQSM